LEHSKAAVRVRCDRLVGRLVCLRLGAQNLRLFPVELFLRDYALVEQLLEICEFDESLVLKARRRSGKVRFRDTHEDKLDTRKVAEYVRRLRCVLGQDFRGVGWSA
jgi:hypothetical protein